MPILFMISGILILLILFNFLNVEKFGNKIFILIFLSLFNISFFVGTINISDVTFNLLQIVLLIFIYFVLLTRISFFHILTFVFNGLVYYLLLTMPNCYTIFSSYIFIFSFSTLFLFFVNGFKSKIFVFLNYLIINSVILFAFEFNNLSFLNIDLLFIFNSLVVMFVYFLISKWKMGGRYVQKDNRYYSFDNCKYYGCE